jgi:flavocytochrome c
MTSIKKESQLPKQVDVIVVGSGYAGMAAAIEASLKGGTVIVLEEMKAIGGNSILSDGGIAAPDTQEQHNAGIIDSIDLMIEDMMKSGEGQNDLKIVSVICEHAREAYLWSQNVLDVPYAQRVEIFGGHQVPRCYTPVSNSGATMIINMKKKLEELGTPIHLGVSVDSFIHDVDHRIIGVNVNWKFEFNHDAIKEMQTIYASKAIIVAGGGFAADVAFRQNYDMKLDASLQTTNKVSTTSKLLQACMAVDAAAVNLDLLQCIPWTTPDEIGYGIGGRFGDYIVSSYGILVNPKTGERFVNELGNRKVVTDKILETGNWVVGIVDEKTNRSVKWDLSSALKRGVVKSFESLDDLAKEYAIPAMRLKETVDDYHKMVSEGKDIRFHKKIEAWMNPISNPPFYAMRIYPKTHYTLGGLVIDADAHVLDLKGAVIGGLFAVGEITGLTHGANRLGSCSVTECLVMGRIAGQKAMEE